MQQVVEFDPGLSAGWEAPNRSTVCARTIGAGARPRCKDARTKRPQMRSGDGCSGSQSAMRSWPRRPKRGAS